jgi:hypothetical protein
LHITIEVKIKHTKYKFHFSKGLSNKSNQRKGKVCLLTAESGKIPVPCPIKHLRPSKSLGKA